MKKLKELLGHVVDAIKGVLAPAPVLRPVPVRPPRR
jgi:hypothetical protein